jgi:hypothetical protein
MSMKNSSDTIGNLTRDLPTCSAVPQPTALTRAPDNVLHRTKIGKNYKYLTSQTIQLNIQRISSTIRKKDMKAVLLDNVRTISELNLGDENVQ